MTSSSQLCIIANGGYNLVSFSPLLTIAWIAWHIISFCHIFYPAQSPSFKTGAIKFNWPLALTGVQSSLLRRFLCSCREAGERGKSAQGTVGHPFPLPVVTREPNFLNNFIGIVEGASPVEEREFTVLLTQISIQCFSMPKIFSVFTCLSPGPEGQPDSLFAAFSLGLYTKTHFHRVRKKTRAYYCLRGNTEKIVKHR